ncbi:PP2C family protein-serine/threonine phosphatase [Nocardiopsis lambiniae]|uniref:PP2C family protein-serine/threonine phosphatase n=1 Tax=Nocardiopsis lambiniae TaxID=3075539 RepID=A0ABU2M9G6_9ACTN|nr:PP2C family protein-serine/threonine phosphatase [Nocardiopsis sp. DSM 44743]MDT0329257.1 PP2C family protein-serine/threonine phosphatase [Nocardiopsis sp. DSM 44743]
MRESLRGLAGVLHPERLTEQAVRLPLDSVADVCVLFAGRPGGSPRWTAGVSGRENGGDGAVVRGRWPVETALAAPWLTEGAESGPGAVDLSPGDPAEELLREVTGREISGQIRVVPLPGLAGAFGALLWYRRYGRFTPSEADLLSEYAERVGSALGSAHLYQYQARTATTLKAALVPEPLPRVDRVELGSSFRSAFEVERIGGDFYEVEDAGDLVHFSFGDVCGKGNDAAVLTGLIRQSLQALRLVETAPLRLLELLNVLLLRTDPEKFSTMVLGTARPLPGGGLRVRAAGGGHPAPLVLGVDGTVREFALGGIFVGAIEEAVFREAETDLAPGEAMVVYSDGVTEARNPLLDGEMLGEERLARLLTECGGMPAPAIADRVAQAVGDWLGGAEHDDITVLVLQAVATPGTS